MPDFREIVEAPGSLVVTGAPEGFDARLVAGLARAREAPVLHIARDEPRMTAFEEAIRFFAPDLAVVTFPAWDCLPYDRLSPNNDVESRRMTALSLLADGAAKRGLVVLTTMNAAVQRVPARDAVSHRALRARPGNILDLDGLLAYLAENGYSRSGTVMEPGEFAVRGGIVDIFPPGLAEPLRLDLFGDTLESIRRFDPLTQRSTGTERELALVPVSEVPFTAEAIRLFRKCYVEHFGAVSGPDPLYESVSAGRPFAGMEHWLPLFHDRLETLFDYLPGAIVSLDHLAEEAREARLTLVRDYYEARAGEEGSGRESFAASTYKPLPPEELYIETAEWQELLARRKVRAFSDFDIAETVPEARARRVDAGGRKGRDFAPERLQPGVNPLDILAEHVAALRASGKRILVAAFTTGARDRLMGLLRDHGIHELDAADGWAEAEALARPRIAAVVLGIEHGFVADDLAVITEQDILGDRLVRRSRRSRRAENFLTEAASLSTGDLVVHIDHGVGRYEGLQAIEVQSAPHDCLAILYDGGDKLYLPVENIEMLSRYGADEGTVALDRLGGAGWQARKARLKERIREIADELIRIAAERTLRTTEPLNPPDGLYDEFCARFPYDETEDQAQAIDEVLDDLAAGRPMDRLVCGDVGFGKTEVALRSAFVTAFSGRQVALIAPTTLLARQHYGTFRQRFSGYPVRIAQLSRFVTPKEAAEVRRGLADGSVDIVIGTHALLAKSIRFKSLGLLIVDEEQHFGVAHKERLKKLKADIHVLTLTATPIPRTLQQAMSSIRELSLIATPPVDRLAVRTFVLPFDRVVVREALMREHYRGGQSFYVCPRVMDLPEAAEFLEEVVPEVKFVTAHGQLPPRDLEDVMTAFYEGRYDVLLSTNIVESGLDIPTANTLIIHRADRFGLAQLYQLRGRIGRSKTRGYAYLTVPPRRALTPGADKRLKVMKALDTLGAGFTLASHDLDIRGAGNLLGEEQSGHIREVGFELYQEMLEEAIAGARRGEGLGGEAHEAMWSPQINIGTAVLIPEAYVADLNLRLGLYRRLAALEGEAEIEGFAAELIDRFGPLPEEVEHLLKIVSIKGLCRAASVEKVDAGPRGATLAFRAQSFPDPAGLVDFITRQQGSARLRPDHSLVYTRRWETPEERLAGVHRLLGELARIAKAPAREAEAATA